MSEDNIMRLASMGVAIVALIVAGCVGVSKEYGETGKGSPVVRVLFIASKTIIALALVAVAYHLTYNNWSQ